MSALNVDSIIPESGSNIFCYRPNTVAWPGGTVQVVHNMVFKRVYYSIPNNDGGMRGDVFAEGINQGGTIIRPLDITIAPKSRRNCVQLEFNIFYEAHQDIVFAVLRDGNLIGAADSPNVDAYSIGRWVGAGVSRYDNNNDSTPSYIQLNWIDNPSTINPVTYSVAVKSAGGSNFDFTLNATLSNYLDGADAYEQGVSFAIAQEIGR